MGSKRGEYILHKVNPTSFKKGHSSWRKGISVIPLEGDRNCDVCGKFYHYKIPQVSNLPKTCSKECRYKSTSNAQKKPKVPRICAICGKDFEIFPSWLKRSHNEGTYCSLECRFKNNQMKYTKKEKTIAVNKMNWAIKTGVLKRLPCKDCGKAKTEGHHYKGYSAENWLNVIWLCRLHHMQEHERLRRKNLNPTL